MNLHAMERVGGVDVCTSLTADVAGEIDEK
jgi:hypothetical protein